MLTYRRDGERRGGDDVEGPRRCLSGARSIISSEIGWFWWVPYERGESICGGNILARA